MEKIKLLVFDIDGTLVDRSKLVVEQSAKDAINQAKSLGYEVLVATGRSYFFIVDDVINNINSDYYVTVNGAALNDSDGRLLKAYNFDEISLKTIIDYARLNSYPLAIKYEDCMGVYTDYDKFVTQYCGLEHPKVNYLITDTHDNFHLTKQPLGIFIFAPHECIDDLRVLMPNLNFIAGEKGTIEAIRSDVDKTKNIEDVLKRLNIGWENVMAFGDGNNDRKMLEKAKIGVAMGNASDLVKSSSNYVTTSVLDDGIYLALKHFKII